MARSPEFYSYQIPEKKFPEIDTYETTLDRVIDEKKWEIEHGTYVGLAVDKARAAAGTILEGVINTVYAAYDRPQITSVYFPNIPDGTVDTSIKRLKARISSDRKRGKALTVLGSIDRDASILQRATKAFHNTESTVPPEQLYQTDVVVVGNVGQIGLYRALPNGLYNGEDILPSDRVNGSEIYEPTLTHNMRPRNRKIREATSRLVQNNFPEI
jgi:hypothetical protein